MERLSLLLLLATAIAAIQICSTLAQSGGDGNDTSEEFSGSGTGDSLCYIISCKLKSQPSQSHESDGRGTGRSNDGGPLLLSLHR